jgi:hypothetical protein
MIFYFGRITVYSIDPYFDLPQNKKNAVQQAVFERDSHIKFNAQHRSSNRLLNQTFYFRDRL